MAELLTRTVGPSGAKRSLRKAFNKQRPLFLWGPPGIGKSDIIKQLGKELDAHVIDVRLSLWEPTDIKGIPFFASNWHLLHCGFLPSCLRLSEQKSAMDFCFLHVVQVFISHKHRQSKQAFGLLPHYQYFLGV